MPFDNPHQTPFGDLELLADARNRISDQNKWTKGRFKDGDHRYCLVASLSLACASHSFYMPNRTERWLAGMLAKHIPPSEPFWMKVRFLTARRRLMSFNDDPRTCHADVMTLFDRTSSDLARPN